MVQRDTPWPDGTPCWVDLGTDDVARATSQEVSDGSSSRSGGLLNEWESWYMRDRAGGIWPQSAAYHDCTPDYKGWLEFMHFQNEEMSQEQYLTELQRIRETERQREETSAQWAGSGRLANGIRKGQERFQKDNRFNRLS